MPPVIHSLAKTRELAHQVIDSLASSNIETINPRKLLDVIRSVERKNGQDPYVFAQELRKASKENSVLLLDKAKKIHVQHALDMYMGLGEEKSSIEEDGGEDKPSGSSLTPPGVPIVASTEPKSKYQWNALKGRFEPVGAVSPPAKKRGRPRKDSSSTKTEVAGDGGMGPSFNDPEVYANSSEPKKAPARVATEAKKLSITELKSLVQSIFEQVKKEKKEKKKLLLKDKLKEATDPETGLDLPAIKQKLQTATSPKEKAYWLGKIQNLTSAHFEESNKKK